MNTNAQSRPNKGKSLLIFPADYTVIDIETTGLDPKWDEIIELAALRVRGGKVVESFQTLVRPTHDIDDFIADLTGITNRELLTAPFIAQALPGYLEFIGDDVVVGHNAHFDVNFIYDAAERFCGRTFKNDIVDTMRLARHILPDLSGHSLSNVSHALGVVRQGEHRALVDCETTYAVLEALRNTGYVFHSDSRGYRIHRSTKAADITAEEGLEQPDNPLYGKVCVFTGVLSITRKDAMQAVANIGGICADSVTKKTNYLILGNNDYCASIKDGKSSKQKRAEELILKGQDLQILSESVFFEYINQIEQNETNGADMRNQYNRQATENWQRQAMENGWTPPEPEDEKDPAGIGGYQKFVLLILAVIVLSTWWGKRKENQPEKTVPTKAAASQTVETTTTVLPGSAREAVMNGELELADIQHRADALGWSTDAWQGWYYIASQTGTKMEAIEEAAKNINQKLAAEDAEFLRALGELGISKDQAKAMKPEELFEKVIYGLQAMED